MLKIIEVIPNPYIALDKDGVPQGVVSAGMPGIYIGAQLDLVASLKTGKNRFYFPLNREGNAKRKVQLNADLTTAIRAGELIVASETVWTRHPKTGEFIEQPGESAASLCGLTKKEFLPADKALEAEKAKALEYWTALKGKGAKLGDIPREATPEDSEDPAPIQTARKQITPTVTKEG